MGWLFRNNRGRDIGTAEKKVKAFTDAPAKMPENVYFILDGKEVFPTNETYVRIGIKESFLVYSHTARRTVFSRQEMHHFYRFIG